METEETTKRRRTTRRYSDVQRERLIREHTESGLTKKAFCAKRGIDLRTFHGWRKRLEQRSAALGFAQVDLAPSAPASIEVLLSNGVRVGVWHLGKRERRGDRRKVADVS